MATAESTGPCYAPDDPTLPKPWVGLMDGSSSLLYYWNPETNVTQYEKPVSLPPPLPSGPPPTTSTPKLAQVPTPHSMQLNGVPSQSSQQFTQSTPQQVQQFSQLPLQNGQMSLQQQVPNNQGKQQHGSQMGQVIQQQGQLQHSNKQMLSHMGQQMTQQGSQNYPQHPGQQMQQQDIRQVPQHVGQQQLQHQNPHMQQPHGQQYMYPQQLHYMANHRSMPPQGQQNTQAQVAQGLQFTNQPDYKAAVSKWETVDFHQGNQTGFPATQFQQAGTPSSQSLPAATNSVPTPLTSGHMGQPQQFSGVAANMQQPAQMVQSQQNDLAQQQYGLRFPNQMGSSMMHRGYENSVHGRPGADHYFNAKMEGPSVSPHQLKLAPLSMSRNQQDSRAGTVPLQNVTPGYAGDFTSTRNMHSHGNAAPPLRTTDITGLSPTEIYCQEHEVTATGDNVPAPFMTFESSGLPPEILQDIRAAGFLSPTPIQAQTWPIALQSRDIVAIAKTGSGKTLGYLIPAFILLQQRHNNPQNGPTILVLAPTRELATQIQDEVIKFGRSSRVSCTCLYGGAPKGPQLRELERGADIVVATPGRLNDILEMKKIDFRQVSLLVLDEADRMLDMGFEPQIRKIVNEIPPRRQTLMYTATWPKEVRKIAADLLVNPVQVNIGRVDELAANKSITQYVEVVSQMEKERRLEQIIRSQVGGSKIIIFCSTKRLCDQLARNIGHNFPAAAIHGDKSQGERDWVLNQFRSGKSPILVATDVAARGLDIKDIRVVINYDFPNGIEDYVHRIGRTGRAGATGVAYTFLSEQDWKHTADLVKVLEGANQNVPPEVREMVLRGGSCLSKGRGGMNRFDSGNGGGRWDSGGRGGMRDGGRGGPRDFGFGGQSGMRDGNFGVRGGMRDGNFGGHGGSRDGNFGGHGGSRDSPFNNHAGRNDSFGGRGNRGRGFGGPGGSHPGWRNDRGLHDRFNNMDGRGRGRGRFDGRREVTSRSRGRSYSRSPERVRAWDRGRSRSRSHSRSSRSRSRSRSWTRSRSRSRSRSRDRTRTHSRSPSRSPKVSRSPKRARSRSQSPRRSHSSSRSQFFEAAERLQEENNDAVMNASTLPADAESHKPGLLPGAEQLPVFEGTEEKGLETPEVADLQSVAET